MSEEQNNRNSSSNPIRFPPVQRAHGLTGAERRLQKLCERSFLTLWSYPGIYRDQFGKGAGNAGGGRGDGKEVCDLLVVFEKHVLIFSDKDCAFPDSGDLKLDWPRWYRKAVQKSAEQVYGAERWIKNHPDRLFLDRECSRPFPVEIPPLDQAIFHRIVVAHDGARRCREHFGGSGSLIIQPALVGVEPTQPFVIGQVDPVRGYVHVLDDTTLGILMETLDTISDFVAYLEKKEKFVLSGKLGMAAGEEELLATYLKSLNVKDEHDFVVPYNVDSILIDEGVWEEFAQNPQRLAQIEVNEVSYMWDALIETFCHHIYAGTSHTMSHPGLENQEKLFRWFARESRTRRRILARGIHDLVWHTPLHKRATRVVMPTEEGDPYYLFLLLPQLPDLRQEEYREMRGELLQILCRVVKVKFPTALDIVGFATETGTAPDRSEDAVYFDARMWTEEDEEETKRLQQELGLLLEVKQFRQRELEYPDIATGSSQIHLSKSRKPSRYPPTRACHCGSGQKYKRCCGRIE